MTAGLTSHLVNYSQGMENMKEKEEPHKNDKSQTMHGRGVKDRAQIYTGTTNQGNREHLGRRGQTQVKEITQKRTMGRAE